MNKRESLLSILSGILFGFSFPPFSFTLIPIFSLVPYLVLIYSVTSFWKTLKLTYLTFFIASLISLYWAGGFTHMRDPYLMIAGFSLLLWQPAFYLMQAIIFYQIRKKYSNLFSLLIFPLIWVMCEWLYAYGEFAFPWLTIGNSMTYQLHKIQFADLTGVYGISLWVLFLNSFIVLNYFKFKELEQFGLIKFIALIFFAIGFYFLPDFYNSDFKQNLSNEKKIKIGIIQPNVDSWEKWDYSISSKWEYVQKLFESSKQQKLNNVDISVWPETAIPFDLPSFEVYFNQLKKEINDIDLSIISGFADVKYYEKNAPITASTIKDKIKYDSFNSILFLQPNEFGYQSYAKIRLVPFAERVPYAESVPWLIEPLRWGVGISNWGKGNDSTIFLHKKSNTKFLSMICYESIFPEFVASFVNKGAEFCVFITQDSWWGNTSGARQHQQFAVLRAIENRRWIVRCANGGISCFIDPFGNTYNKTEMYKTASIEKIIYPQTYKTFYTEHGDYIAKLSSIISILFFTFSFFKK
ncbi:MAG: apolipoprotein N-acyltransferase [Bacteroidetes bacterium]|nr:apolipoprotein N-acyltransferase [Bacteroidota bacterium]